MEYFRAKFSHVVTFKIFYTARQDISVNQKLERRFEDTIKYLKIETRSRVPTIVP